MRARRAQLFRCSRELLSYPGCRLDRIKVGVFDENLFFRIGIAHSLKADPEMEVVAEGGTALEALRLTRALSPHVVVLDYTFLEGGLKLAQSITAIPFVKLLILSFSLSTKQAFEAFAAGARGYVFKGVSGQDLREAVRAVNRGEGYVSPALAADMMMNQTALEKGDKQNPMARLSYREGQIFDLLCAGLKNQEIGARLNVAERTVKHYITRIFEILNVRNCVEAAALASHRNAISETLNSSLPTLPNEMPLLPAKRKGEENSGKTFQINLNDKAHSTMESCYSVSLPPSKKIAAASCFASVFGHLRNNGPSQFAGTHIFLSDAVPRRRR